VGRWLLGVLIGERIDVDVGVVDLDGVGDLVDEINEQARLGVPLALDDGLAGLSAALALASQSWM
jgi:hypothetical protein